ncbi:hypothetical protein I3760_01G041500 [Carya illinoinensis]|nr:hypothetical protein I3760_01G041500 [Carya illinoinensis]
MLVAQWVAHVRDVAYDVEDVIESYVLKVGSRKGGGIQNVLKMFGCILVEAKAIDQTRSEIGEIMKRISTLNSSLQDYGIKLDSMDGGGPSSLSEKIREQRQTYAHVEHDHVVVGLEDNLKETIRCLEIKVVACLTKEVKYKYRVDSICGMDGLGKTTLARKAYHYPQVKSHFNCHVELTTEICEMLCRNKCLVVLDDIWKVEDWNRLSAAFQLNDTNNKILLTSRNVDMALQVDPRQGHLHELKLLNDGNNRELLQNIAISWREEKEMVSYCKGLPLAVIVLRGLLATKRTLEEWKQVHRNVKSYPHQHKDPAISMVLALSYDDLPYHLKLCFLYLGHFPEDFEIQTKELIRMWMAKGLILQTGSNKETLENVGEQYLKELVQRCMVQVGKKNFCVDKALLENFLHIINVNHESNEEIEAPIGDVRRVAINSGSSDPMSFGFIFSSTFQKYFHLRDIIDFPPEIKSLIHLRFLSLRYTNVRSISSLKNLKCLQTLDLRSTLGDVNVPNDVFKNMEHLWHMYLPLSEVSGKLQLPNASKLQTLVNIPIFICDVKDPTAGFDEYGKNFHIWHKRVDITPIKLPEHDKIYPHLAQLRFGETYLGEDPMLILENFHNLKILHPSRWAYIEKKMICFVRGFPQLQSLSLSHLDNLEDHLKIGDCHNLVMVPDELQFVGNLQKFENLMLVLIIHS